MKNYSYSLIGLRIAMGFIMIWAFVDKLFGLGFATPKASAWINGGSPTTGFLAHGVHGPFATLFSSLAGNMLVDWLFMIGLLFVGASLLFNRFMKWACLVGAVMMLLMYLALIPSANNPLIDDHIIYAIVFAVLAFSPRPINN